MTSQEIVNTEWAKSLLEQERKNNAAPGTHEEAINIVANRTPVRVIFLGDSAEVYVDTFVLEVTETVDEAIEWCKRFDLPIEAVNGETYHPPVDVLAELEKWLEEKRKTKDSHSVMVHVTEVLNKIQELKKGTR